MNAVGPLTSPQHHWSTSTDFADAEPNDLAYQLTDPVCTNPSIVERLMKFCRCSGTDRLS